MTRQTFFLRALDKRSCQKNSKKSGRCADLLYENTLRVPEHYLLYDVGRRHGSHALSFSTWALAQANRVCKVKRKPLLSCRSFDIPMMRPGIFRMYCFFVAKNLLDVLVNESLSSATALMCQTKLNASRSSRIYDRILGQERGQILAYAHHRDNLCV